MPFLEITKVASMMPWDEPVDISNEEGKTPIQAFPKGNKMES